MSRKRKATARVVEPDSRHSSVKITKFINKIMLDGKKRTAERIVYDALDQLSDKVKEPAASAFEKVLKHVMPLMEVRSRRVGGSTYQVPVEVRHERSLSLAMRWLALYSRERGGRSMSERLANELIDAYNKAGLSVKKREETHKMAEANKAFAHFRW